MESQEIPDAREDGGVGGDDPVDKDTSQPLREKMPNRQRVEEGGLRSQRKSNRP